MADARIKTFLLLAALTAMVLWIGQFFGGTGLFIAALLVLVINGLAYFFSDKIALKMYRAKEVSEKDQPELHQMVAEVSELAGIPKPKVYLIPTENPNAFATGRNPKNSSVAFTHGILRLLDKRELRGVTAHEIAHIKNRDILVTTVTAMIAGIISYVATMAQWAAIFGGFGGRDNQGGIIQLLVLIILAPILALIIRMAVSRTREYYADKRGAQFIKDPGSLADALQKLERGARARPLNFGPEGGESLFIVNPFAGRSFLKILSTHPPTDERVKRLRAMA
jgi:heat shock protein HtpX